MPTVPILMPQLGESIAEATVIRLGVAVGDSVRTDQEIIEVETNKAVMGVTTLCDGVVSEIKAQEGHFLLGGNLAGFAGSHRRGSARTGVDTLESIEAKRSASHKAKARRKRGESAFRSSMTMTLRRSPRRGAQRQRPAGAHWNDGRPLHFPRMRARMDDLGLREADISASPEPVPAAG
jgi:pyruvate/2-oxoglutarate dehydrogenase complex dihydrolipoamide acyltransferase (E2) component